MSSLYLSPAYWLFVALALMSLKQATRFRWGDFRSVSCVFISQYVAHSLVLFGLLHDLTVFVLGFAVVFAVTLTILRSRASGWRSERRGRPELIDAMWFPVCRIFLLVYWSARLALYPFVAGALDMQARLYAQEEHRILFFLSLAYLPAFSACAYRWILTRMRALDFLTLGVTLVGVYGSGSKAAFLPLVLVFLGVASLAGVAFRSLWVPAVVSIGSMVTFFIRLAEYFPGHSPSDLVNLFLYRVLSNSDSLEYIAALGDDPQRYPFAGWGALFPFISPFVGYEYAYSPGVWLYGSVFGDWRGYGPNPGILMDYFANLSWWGLLGALISALYLRTWEIVGGSVGASFLSIAYLLLVDVTLFQVAFVIWASMLFVLTVVSRLFGVAKPATATSAQPTESTRARRGAR